MNPLSTTSVRYSVYMAGPGARDALLAQYRADLRHFQEQVPEAPRSLNWGCRSVTRFVAHSLSMAGRAAQSASCLIASLGAALH